MKRYAEVQELLAAKGYEVVKTGASKYECQGHVFRRVVDLYEWADGLPTLSVEAASADEYCDNSQEECDEAGDGTEGNIWQTGTLHRGIVSPRFTSLDEAYEDLYRYHIDEMYDADDHAILFEILGDGSEVAIDSYYPKRAQAEPTEEEVHQVLVERFEQVEQQLGNKGLNLPDFRSRGGSINELYLGIRGLLSARLHLPTK